MTLTSEILAEFEVPCAAGLVRTLRESDNRALEWHGGADLRSFYQDQWWRHVAGDACVLVVEWNRFPVAQAAIYWHGKPTHPHIPDLQSVRVFPAFRGLGFGTQIIHVCEQQVRARGFAQVSLSVALDNPRARALYERVGYAVVGQPYDDEWSYTDARGEERRVAHRIHDMVKSF